MGIKAFQIGPFRISGTAAERFAALVSSSGSARFDRGGNASTDPGARADRPNPADDEIISEAEYDALCTENDLLRERAADLRAELAQLEAAQLAFSTSQQEPPRANPLLADAGRRAREFEEGVAAQRKALAGGPRITP